MKHGPTLLAKNPFGHDKRERGTLEIFNPNRNQTCRLKFTALVNMYIKKFEALSHQYLKLVRFENAQLYGFTQFHKT